VPLHLENLVALAALLFGLVAINLSAWCLGCRLTRRWPVPWTRSGERALGELAVGLLLLPYGVLLLASLHLLARPTLFALLLLPVLSNAPAFARGRCRAQPERCALPDRRTLLGVAVVAVLLANSFLGLYEPSPGWDALTYHLAIPERYLFENGIVVTPFHFATAFPQSVEMLYTLALALGDEVLAKAIHFEFGVLALAALFLLGRRISPRAAWLAPLFLLADPLFLTELDWAHNELAAAFFLAMALLALGDLQGKQHRAQLVYAGVFAGGCLATRYPAGTALVAVCASLWWRKPWGPRAAITGSAWVGGTVLLVMLPWLLRNLVFTGITVSPALQSLFHAPGSEFFHPVSVAQVTAFTADIGMGKSLKALLCAPWNLTLETRPSTYTQSFGFLIGPLHLIGVAAALAARGARRLPPVRTALKILLVFFLIWFFTFQEARYLLPAFVLTALVGAAAFDRVLPARLRSWPPAPSALLALIPLVAVALGQARDLDRLPFRYAVALGGHSAPLEQQPDPSNRAAKFLRTLLGPEDRLLLFYESRGYLFRGLDYIPFFPAESSPVLQLVHRAESVEDLRCRLEEMGVTHLLLNQRIRSRAKKVFVEGYGPRDFARDMALVNELLDHRASPVWSQGSVRVVRLAPAPRCAERADGQRAGR
jgi:hypothetical protein